MLKLSENRGRWSPVCFSFFGLWHTFRPPWRVWKPLSGVAGQKCTVCQISQRERASHRDRHRVRGGERHQGREVSWMRYRARRGETETNRSSARLPALTSQLQPVRHVIRGDVFGFTETKASSPSDVIQRGRLSIWSYLHGCLTHHLLHATAD